LGRREQPERRPPVPPCSARRIFRVEQHIRPWGPPQKIRHRECGLAAADDHDVEGVAGVAVSAHAGLVAAAPPVSMSTANLSGRSLARIAAASLATSYGTRMNSTGSARFDGSSRM